MVPAGERAAFEMVEPEIGLQLAILLLDRPPLMREQDETALSLVKATIVSQRPSNLCLGPMSYLCCQR